MVPMESRDCEGVPFASLHLRQHRDHLQVQGG